MRSTSMRIVGHPTFPNTTHLMRFHETSPKKSVHLKSKVVYNSSAKVFFPKLLLLTKGIKMHLTTISVADLRGARGTPPGVQILSISCSFWENLAKSYVGAPPGSWRLLDGEILDPPLYFGKDYLQNIPLMRGCAS